MKKFFLIVAAALMFGRVGHAGDVTFATKPSASTSGNEVHVAFAVSEKTDVEVAVLNTRGEVVRHLAAGVLAGERTPPEPLKQGLSQSLAWDGNNDFGKKAEGGPFKVRVRAGTSAKFGRFIGEDPYTFGGIDGMVVGDNGNLYISGSSGPANQTQKTLREFGPDGAYLRTVLPFAANLPPGSMKEVARWDEAAKTWRPRNLSMLNPDFYSSNNGYGDYGLVNVSTKTGILFTSQQCVMGLNMDGSISGPGFHMPQVPWPIFDAKNADNQHYGHPWHYQVGRLNYTTSADGKYMYLSGPVPNPEKRAKMDPRFPLGGVYRMRIDGKDEMKLFVTVPATFDGPWQRDSGKFYSASCPVDVTGSDVKGNIYVTDREANRVVVFNEEGKQIGEIAVKNPHQVIVHPVTGAIYVMRMVCNGWGSHAMSLDKFENFNSGATAVAKYDKINNRSNPILAITVKDGRTLIWMAGVPEGLIALQDNGTSMAPVETKFKTRPDGQRDFARIATDPNHEQIYVSNGENLIYRYNGDTGEGGLLRQDNKPFFAPDLTVGYDGLLYVRAGEAYSGPLIRVTTDLKPAPFSGTNSNKLYDIYGRYGIGFCEKGVGVGPDGKVYDCWMYDFQKYFVSGWNPDGTPMKGKYLTDKLKQSGPVWKNIKLPDNQKIDSAIIGPVNSDNGGIRVDLKGNIYLGLRVQPKGFKAPAGFEKAEDYASFTGSVVKFSPEGGVVLGVADAESKNASAPRQETNKGIIEGALSVYPGAAPFSGGGYGGNSSCCVCRVSRFDLDRYGRLALPNAVTTSVAVVDNAGNAICSIGKYGNFDSQYVPAGAKSAKPIVETPDIPLAWPTGVGFTEKSIYVCDTLNRRVVRADFIYAAEALCDIK